MTYKLTITQKPAYLHFIVTGQNSVENIVQYFDEIHRECAARKCFRILIEERLDGPRLGILDVFKIVADESDKARGFFKAIAYVDVNATDDSMKFAENAAVNRSLPVSVFSTVANAEKWLMNKDIEKRNTIKTCL
jgi:enoyl-[acyl-carrier-protein] reductase (NADH)